MNLLSRHLLYYLDIIDEAVRAKRANEILDCMACVKALLNSQIGMTKCMERPQFTKSIASILSCTEELVNSVWRKERGRKRKGTRRGGNSGGRGKEY